jgi:hypothetical protein
MYFNNPSVHTHHRIEVTNRVIGHISTLVRETYPWLQLNNHPIFLMGDLNEDFHPVRILNQAGFTDCFTALGLPTPATHPARPSSPEEEAKSDRRVIYASLTSTKCSAFSNSLMITVRCAVIVLQYSAFALVLFSSCTL